MASGIKEIVRIRHKNYKWDRPFTPYDYLNPEAITILYENWLQSSTEIVELREQVIKLGDRNSELDKINAVYVAKQDSQRKWKWLPFSLQLVSVITMGIGVNIVTSAENHNYGWVFISISVILEIITFISISIDK
jgi:hypothetical protein